MSRNIRAVSLILLLLSLFLIFVILNFKDSFLSTSPVYYNGNTVPLTNGYYLVSDDKKFMYILAGLSNAYQKDGDVYAEFLTINDHKEKITLTFLIFDHRKNEKFFIVSESTNKLIARDGIDPRGFDDPNQIVKNLNKYKGKTLILLIQISGFDSKDSFYSACNALFYKKFTTGQTTTECKPRLWQVTAYVP